MIHRRSFHISLSVGVAALAASCGESSGPRKITQTQSASMAPGEVKVGATSAERFGGGFAMPHGAESSPTAAGRELAYDVPAGWTELPPAQFREVNLKPAGHPDAECYLTSLAITGGIPENVNRWRKQFGQPELDAAAIMALPIQKLLSTEALLIELEGSYTGAMTPGGAAATKPDFALVGLVTSLGDQLVTVKMIGPKDVLRAERPKFDDFVRSLRGVPSNGLAEGGAARNRNSSDPHGSGMPASSAHTSPPVGGFDAMGIQYTPPAGWTKEPDRPTRIATLRPPGAKATECSITAMPGDGGGTLPNLNRWRIQQMGLPPLTATDVEKLPKVPMLGVQGVVVDWRGSFEDTMNNRKVAQARFLGAVAITGSRAIFVKLSGPETEIDDKVRDAFMDLCGSLKE